MHTCTIHQPWSTKRLFLKLDNLSKEDFFQKVKEYFGENVDMGSLVLETPVNIPSLYRGPDSCETILADGFWSWKTLDEHDQKLLEHYIEITFDNTKTIEEARNFKQQRYSFINR